MKACSLQIYFGENLIGDDEELNSFQRARTTDCEICHQLRRV